MKSIFTNTAVNSRRSAANTKLTALMRMVSGSLACMTRLPSSTPRARPWMKAVITSLYGRRKSASMPCSNTVFRGRSCMTREKNMAKGTGMSTNNSCPTTSGRNESRQMASAEPSMATIPWKSTSCGPR